MNSRIKEKAPGLHSGAAEDHGKLARTESPSPTDAAPVIAPIVDNGLSEPQKERLIELEKVITDRLTIGWDFSRACLLSDLDYCEPMTAKPCMNSTIGRSQSPGESDIGFA